MALHFSSSYSHNSSKNRSKADALACVDCALFVTCDNPKKGADFVCPEFTPLSSVGVNNGNGAGHAGGGSGSDAPWGLDEAALGDIFAPPPAPAPEEGGINDIVDTDYEELPVLPAGSSTRLIGAPPHTEQGPSTGAEEEEAAASSASAYKETISSDLDDMVANPLPISMDLDLRGFPLARNIFEFTTSPRFLGLRPWTRQMEILVNIFGEWCCRCTDPKVVSIAPRPHLDVPMAWTLEEFKAHVQLLDWGVCPRCHATKAKQIESGLVPLVLHANLVCGQRVGKSQLIGWISSYILHGLIKLGRPALYYGQVATETLAMQITAPELKIALEKVWRPIRTLLTTAPWFADLTEYANAEAKSRFGEKAIVLKETFYSNRIANIDFRPYKPDWEKLRGGTSAFAGVDELGMFGAGSKEGQKSTYKGNADETVRSLGNALTTLSAAFKRRIAEGNQNFLIQPLLLTVSSPRDKRDKIMRIHAEAEENPQIYSVRRPTWEISPIQTRESLEHEFKRDFRKAARDFGAEPAESAMPYFDGIAQVAPSVDWRRPNRFMASQRLEAVYSTANAKGPRRANALRTNYMTADLEAPFPKDGNNRILAVDLGRVNNSAAMVTGFWDTDTNTPVIDGVLEVMATERNPDGSPVPINFDLLYRDLILPLVSKANITLVATDQWQSDLLRDRVVSDVEDILAEKYSVKPGDFTAFKELVQVGGFSLPACEVPLTEITTLTKETYPEGFIGKPCAHLVYQMLTAEAGESGVTKGRGVTDDILRAAVLLGAYLLDPAYRELCTGQVRLDQKSLLATTPFAVSAPLPGSTLNPQAAFQANWRAGPFGFVQKNNGLLLPPGGPSSLGQGQRRRGNNSNSSDLNNLSVGFAGAFRGSYN